MTIKWNRASNQYLWTTDNAKFTYPNSDWSVGFVIIVDGQSAITENQVIFATGALNSGSLICSYYGPAHPTNPSSIGVTLGSSSVILASPNGSIPAGAWYCTLQRIGQGLVLRRSPILQQLPTDDSAVTAYSLGTIASSYDGPNGLQIATRGDRPLRLFDQTLGRLFRVNEQLTTLEVAKLAYGMEPADIGKTPVFYFPFSNGGDYVDVAGGHAMTAVGTPYTTGQDPGFGYAASAPSAPVFSAAPVIVGTPVVGAATSYTAGTVSGSPAPAVTRQWYIDGVAISGATGATYTPVAADEGKALTVRETATNTQGSVESTSAAKTVTATPATSDSLTPMPASRPWQRNGSKAAVPMSGTYNTAPASIEAQLISLTDGSTVLQSWTPLTGLVVANNAWSGTLAANLGGGYRAQVRFKDASGNVTFTSLLDANGWGAGVVLAGAGSSTIHGWWNSGTYGGSGYLRRYLTISGKYLWEPFPTSSNGVAKKIAADLSGRLSGATVGMVGTGEAGTTLAEWLVTTGTQFGRLKAAINANGGKIGGLIVSMGSNDVAENLVTSRASHAARLRQFIQNVRDYANQPDLPVLISGYNSRLNVSAQQSDYVRMAERDVGADANVYHFPTFDMVLGSDGTHLDSYDLSGDRANYVFNPVIAGDATYRRGPCITAITYSGTKFFVTIQHRNGSDITPASGISGFTAGDESGSAAVLSAVRVSATRIEVTCDRALGSGAWLKYMAGNAPDTSAPVYDNGAMALPMDVETDMIATADVPGADVTPPVLGGSLTVSSITTSGATLGWPAATDDTAVAGYEYSTNGGTSYTNVGAARTAVLTGLTAGTAYTARVRAYDAAGNRSSPLTRSFTTEAEEPPGQDDFDATKVAPARKVVFPGGTRVVVFGGPAVTYPGGPYQQDGRWTIDKHPLDEFYCVADISFDLAESQATAASVVAAAGGVQVIEQPVLQGTLIAVKVGGLDELSGAANFCTLRVTLANGEQIDRTIWFARLQGTWAVQKDPDDKRYFVADVTNILADSGTQIASALPAIPVGVQVLEQPIAQGALIMVKLGGMDVSADALNHCTLPFLCANGEKFFRTIHFNRVDN